MATRPIGPYSLYWACRIQGAGAFRAGRPIDADPYGVNRQFSGRAWRGDFRTSEGYDPTRRSGLRSLRCRPLVWI
jgi:hypothetical protein